MADAIAPKGGNTSLKGTLIPSYSVVAYGLTTDVDYGYSPNYSETYGSTNWRNAVENGGTANGSNNNTVYYSIYSDRTSQGYGGTNLAVGWGITTNTGVDEAILSTVNRLPAMSGISPHATFGDAMLWLVNNGYFISNKPYYPRVEFNSGDLKYAFDPTFMASLPWTTDRVYELMGNCPTNPYGSFEGDCTSAVNITNGNTPYISTAPSPSNEGYFVMSDEVISGIDAKYSITFSFWFRLENLNNQYLLYVNDNDLIASQWLACYTSSGNLIIIADPRSGGTNLDTLNLGPLSAGVFYLLTVSLDLVNNRLYAWLGNTSMFNAAQSSSPFNYGGSGASVTSGDGSVALGARVSGTYPSTYFERGANALFGSIYIYTDPSTYSFTPQMAEKIWGETVGSYT